MLAHEGLAPMAEDFANETDGAFRHTQVWKV